MIFRHSFFTLNMNNMKQTGAQIAESSQKKINKTDIRRSTVMEFFRVLQ